MDTSILSGITQLLESGDNSDSAIMTMFSRLAYRLGRDDLVREFQTRAASHRAWVPPPPSPESSAHSVAACINQGVAQARAHRFVEAEAAFQLAVRLDPRSLSGYTNLGSACLDQRKFAEAELWFRQATLLDPRSSPAWRLLGSALDAQGKPGAAESAFQEAILQDPQSAESQARMGIFLATTGRPADAEPYLQEAVQRDPQHPLAWNHLASIREQAGRYADAEPAARVAVRLHPDSPDAANLLGVVLAGLDRHPEAVDAYRVALRLRPDFPVALSNLGNALRTLGDVAGAEPPLREAVRLTPDSPEARNNLGVLLVQTARWDAAIEEYHAAIAIRPGYAEAHLNLALALLARGDYESGWQEYEWRWKTRQARPPQIDVPRWDGTPRPGGTILICAEQGLGDTIHFVRYAALVQQRCQTVVLDCQQPVEDLVRSCPGVDRIRHGPPPQPDAWVPLMSLPGLLGMPPAAPLPPVPYLQPPADRIACWRNELSAVSGRKVGIAWQGSPLHKGDRLRSVPLERFVPFAALPGIRLISLQKSPGIEQLTERAGSEPTILDLGSRTGRGLEDAAAVMVHLDLLILVDTALAHVAGALGIPAWVAVPYAADWRWGCAGETTVWYPTLRLFRQPRPGDWDTVFGRIATELAVWSASADRPAVIGSRDSADDANRECDGWTA